MQADPADLTTLAKRLAAVRRAYADSIDLPNLGSAVFAALLGVSPFTYASYERGEAEPTIDFLLALRRKTGISLDWILERTERGAVSGSGWDDAARANPVQAIQANEPAVTA
jgi:transcriptional regulator with XRE-family HTH domain